ncbi:type II toxin-antitoxin system prevent-host-death family antitoxin [Wenzhouxiangella sp. EGI_FJ10305]|uniref:type II toxin-antitoxin system prevent-host-death family antitoxin n=1 Tax=Wenzhouxiangella sp. EGI_FJ10305 TaxID=3243768 RepID=UPI0035DE5A94
MSQVKATDAQRKFGQVLRDAQREPVEILSHGKSAAVLISSHEYARLKARDRRVVLAGRMDEETVRLIEQAEAPAEAAEFDHEVD